MNYFEGEAFTITECRLYILDKSSIIVLNIRIFNI